MNDTNPFVDESNPIATTEGKLAKIASYDRAALNPDPNFRGQWNYIFGAGPGILLAGFLYPSVVATILFVVSLCYGAPIPSVKEFFSVAGPLFFLGGAFGVAFSGVTGAIAFVIIWAMNKSLGNPFDKQTAAISAGSLAGYIPTVGVMYAPALSSQFTVGLFLLSILLPVLAMLMGATGAAWSAKKLDPELSFNFTKTKPGFQLSIMHLMIGTTWVAATFGLANLFGLHFAINVAGWFVLNGVLIGFVRLYRSRRAKKPM